MSTVVNHQFLKKLRTLSVVEGISTLVLFGIAMPMKYVMGIPAAVSVVGNLHGVLFVALACMMFAAVKRVPMKMSLAILGIVAAIFPFGPFVFDRKLKQLEQVQPNSDTH